MAGLPCIDSAAHPPTPTHTHPPSLSVPQPAAATAAPRRYVRKHIGRTVRLRLTPEIRFILDDSIERSERVRAGAGGERLWERRCTAQPKWWEGAA